MLLPPISWTPPSQLPDSHQLLSGLTFFWPSAPKQLPLLVYSCLFPFGAVSLPPQQDFLLSNRTSYLPLTLGLETALSHHRNSSSWAHCGFCIVKYKELNLPFLFSFFHAYYLCRFWHFDSPLIPRASFSSLCREPLLGLFPLPWAPPGSPLLVLTLLLGILISSLRHWLISQEYSLIPVPGVIPSTLLPRTGHRLPGLEVSPVPSPVLRHLDSTGYPRSKREWSEI